MDDLFSLISNTNSEIGLYIVNELEKQGIQGLALSHGAILLSLANHKILNYKELSKKTGKTQQTITTLVKKLIKEEYVVVQVDQNDKRNKLVALSKKGQKFIPIMIDISNRVYEIQYKGFTFEEILQVRNLLTKIQNNFSTQNKSCDSL